MMTSPTSRIHNIIKEMLNFLEQGKDPFELRNELVPLLTNNLDAPWDIIPDEILKNPRIQSVYKGMWEARESRGRQILDCLNAYLDDQNICDFRSCYLDNRFRLPRREKRSILEKYLPLRSRCLKERLRLAIMRAISQCDLSKAEKLNSYPCQPLTKIEYDREVRRVLLRMYRDSLRRVEFEKAERFYAKYKNLIPQSEWSRSIDQFTDEALARVSNLLGKGNFKDAQNFILQRKPILQSRPESYKGLQDYIDATKNFTLYRFKDAEPLLNNLSAGIQERALKLKAYYIAKFLEKEYRFPVNEEQAWAIASSQNTIVCARAGSGKTRTIVARIAFLVGGLEVDPHEILVLVFNRKAASEIRQRLQELFPRLGNFNVRTFHSLAYAIAPPSGEILFDDDGDFSRQRLSEYVQRLTRKIWRPDIRLKLYMWFRQEVGEVDLDGLGFRTDEDYYLYRRSMRYTTLRGERVKSKGEKWIADFLMEHDIQYRYEQPHQWGDRIYRPDFSLLEQRKAVIEHWGIDENDPSCQVPGQWDKS